MLKVLIADDEFYVRQGIKSIVPWNECGFEICGEGTDGDETYEKINSLNPNLVLIDIKMPGMSGLEVIRKSIENGFKGRFVIISGYSEFKYAKEAMKYGVKSYVLKPIDEDELIDIICKIKEEIYEEIEINNNNEVEMELIKKYTLSQLCLNNQTINGTEFINSINGKAFRIALLYNYNNRFYDENIIQVEEYINEKLVINTAKVFKVKNRIAILFYDKGIECVISVLEKVKKDIEKELQTTIFITVGDEVNEIDNINNSYKSAEYLMKRRYLYLENGIIFKDIIKSKNISEFNEEYFLESLYTYIEIGELNKIKETLYNLEEYIRTHSYEEKEIKSLLIVYYVKIKDKIISTYGLTEKLELKSKVIIEEINNKNSLGEVMTFLIEELSYISKVIAIDLPNRGVERVVKYVDNKYYKDLKLEGLAKIFNYNSCYLGKLFKDSTGKSFNTYLDIVRIEEAKKLLIEDKLKVYEICEKVGYKNIDYFYAKFKKHVGISPLNYKKKISYN